MKYTVLIPDFNVSEIQISLEFKLKSEKTELILPSWRPGRYELAGYFKNIGKVKLINSEGITLIAISENKWFVSGDVGRDVFLKYSYQAVQMDAGNSWLSWENSILNPINFLICPMGHEYEKVEVSLDIPPDYQVETQLGTNTNRSWEVESYFDIIDAPFFISKTFNSVTFDVEGIEISIIFMGVVEKIPPIFRDDISRFIKEQFEIFKEFPESSYRFLIYVPDYRFYHGVEHAGSTIIVLGDNEGLFDEKYEHLQGISSHEFFHMWNACKIKPKELYGFPFGEEVRFTTGWVLEGYTTYYGDLVLCRSQVFSSKWFIRQIQMWVQSHMDNPARLSVSLSESSEMLWEYGYKKEKPQKVLSIYTEGALFSLVSHLLIIKTTDGKKTLDDVMRAVWDRFGKVKKGYEAKDILDIYSELIGEEKSTELFDMLIYGKNRFIDFIEDILPDFGISMEFTDNPDQLKGYLGIWSEENKVKWIWPESVASNYIETGDIIKDASFTEGGCILEILRNDTAFNYSFEVAGSLYFKRVLLNDLGENRLRKIWI
ncbi:MAG: hypothetical protein OEW75_03930 [Cyclobacteriaceae bacterium]|nr:hypothetical protein [Cyclobacteriaceae bacterium]